MQSPPPPTFRNREYSCHGREGATKEAGESPERMAPKASTPLVWVDCEVCGGGKGGAREFVVDANFSPPFFLIGFACLLDDRTKS